MKAYDVFLIYIKLKAFGNIPDAFCFYNAVWINDCALTGSVAAGGFVRASEAFNGIP